MWFHVDAFLKKKGIQRWGWYSTEESGNLIPVVGRHEEKETRGQ